MSPLRFASVSEWTSAWSRLRNDSRARRELLHRRREAIRQRKARHHLVQTLGRRDHPGSMLEVSAISLLGDRPGESDDPIDQMLRSSEAVRHRREAYERAIDFGRAKTARPLRNPGSGVAPAVPDGSRTTDPDDRADDQARRVARDRLLDLLRQRLGPARPPQSPLLQSVTQEAVTSQIDESSIAAPAVGRNHVTLPPVATSSISGAIAGSATAATIPDAASVAGTTITGTVIPPSGGGGGGSTLGPASEPQGESTSHAESSHDGSSSVATPPTSGPAASADPEATSISSPPPISPRHPSRPPMAALAILRPCRPKIWSFPRTSPGTC